MQTVSTTLTNQRSTYAVTERAHGNNPAWALLRRVLWAVALVLPALGASAGVYFTSLYSFAGTNDGANPYCALAPGDDGNLYGTTSSGGAYNLGTVFRISPAGALSCLHSFNGTDGAAPFAALVRGKDGNLYGTTYAGGAGHAGTIFQFQTNSTLTTLFSFPGTNDAYQGSYPGAALVQAPDGSLWSTAGYGGLTNASYGGNGYGTVFQLATNGTLAVPVVFANTNGAYPASGLVLGQDGNFYGTATWGGQGITSSFQGYGTIFKLTPGGEFTNIYMFSGFEDGGFIYGRLTQGRDGYLYGAALGGGALGYGTLFKVSTNGSFVPLHTFSYYDSSSPYGGLIEGSDGNFYGTTYGYFFNSGYGSVFRVTPDGTFTNLLFFNKTNGAYPVAALVQGADGNFYGTTSAGGTNGLGTVFKLSVPLPPVIRSLTLTNGTVTLTWSSVAGQTYRPQYTDDLTQTNWSFFAKPAVADGGVMTATDSQGSTPSAHRYYRVVLQQP